MASSQFRFGDYRLDPAARELWLGASMVALPPKSFDCLAYLIEHRERAVGRDELISAVWARVDVSDDVLAQTLLRARRAVGDTGNEQRAIRTVPRFGYRWVLPTEADGAPSSPAVASADPAPRSRTRRGIVLSLAALAILAIASVVAIRMVAQQNAMAPVAARDDQLLMVLPVAVEGAGNDATWIRLGAMDYIASHLRETARRKVLPSEQTLMLLGQDSNPADAGTLHRLELASGASYILAPHAALTGGDWNFVLDVYHGGSVQSYEARAATALDAAGLTTRRFIGSLGVDSVPAAASASAATELAQRMDAAMLAGDLAEAHRLADGAPPELKADPAVSVRIGQIAFRAGQHDDAERAFEPLAGNASLPASVQSQAQMGLGAVAVRRRDFDAADRDYSAAIETLAGQNGRDHPDLLGAAYSGRGVANGARNRIDAALADFGRARVELERAGDHGGMASVEVNRALVEAGRGRYADAVAAFDRAIATFARFDVRDNLAAALLGKANAQAALLDGEGALASSARAEDLAAHLENPLLKRRIRASRVRALLMSGQLADAQRLLDEANAGGDADLQTLRARVLLERGDTKGALDLVAKLIDTPANAEGNLSDLVLIAAEGVRRDGASDVLDRALAHLRAQADAPEDRDRTLALELGEAERLAARNEDGARAHFAAAFAEADQRGSSDALVTAGVAYSHYLVGKGALDEATTVIGRLAPFVDRDYRAARSAAELYTALGNESLARNARDRAVALAGERKP